MLSAIAYSSSSTFVNDTIVNYEGRLYAYLQFKPEEITGIMKDFDEPGFLAPTGLHLGGTKYMVIQGEAGAVIRGKKVFPFFIINSFHNFSYDFKKMHYMF